MATGVTHEIDGRKSRAARSRLAICEACLDLIQEGALQPGADEIAKRAGVSRRSVFNHFVDLAELYDAVVEVGMRRYASLLEPIDASDDVAQRLDRLVQVRSSFMEATAAFTRALTAQALVGTASEQALRVSRVALRREREELERLFAKELDALSAADRTELVLAMSAALSPLQWESFRRTHGVSMLRSSAAIKRTLTALLKDAGVSL